MVVSARKGSLSYDAYLERMPAQLARNFTNNSMVVIYPEQLEQGEYISFSDPLGHNESQHYDKAREWVTDMFKEKTPEH